MVPTLGPCFLAAIRAHHRAESRLAPDGRDGLIAGGGVAAVKALLALRALAPDRARPTLLAPDPVFRYRPLSVTQPFGLGVPRGFDLAEMAMANGGSFITETITGSTPSAAAPPRPAAVRSSTTARDFPGALRWLEVAEDLELYAPSETILVEVQ